MLRDSKPHILFWITFCLLIVGSFVFAQFPVRIPKIFSNPFQKEEALTTSLNDALTEVPFLDSFEPQQVSSLSTLPRGPEGQFIVSKPGAYVFVSQSYCLRAGTYGPGHGKGYLFAPLKGGSAGIVGNVLHRSAAHPEIAQHDVQLLLWAIIARTKPSQMNPELRSTADILLTPDEISRLEGSAFDEVSADVFNRALGKLPPETQQVLNAERQLRDALTTGSLPYGEVERIAVLTGEPLSTKDDRVVPLGRWSFQPEGYFVRYFPDGYSTTEIEVYFPEDFNIVRDTTGRIMQIADSDGRQIAFEYDDSIESASVNKEPSLKAYAFKAVRLGFKFPLNSRMKVDLGTVGMAEWNDSGWTFYGAIEGKGKAFATSARFADVTARYDSAKQNRDGLRKILDSLKRVDEMKGFSLSSTSMQDLSDLMFLTDAVQGVVINASGDTSDLDFDPVDFLRRAWASEFAHATSPKMAKAFRPSLNSVFWGSSFSFLDPAVGSADKSFGLGTGTAMPGERGRQRLGISDRPKEDRDDECKSTSQECQNDAGTSFLGCTSSCLEIGTGSLGQLNRMRICMSNCQKGYDKQNHHCSAALKKCSRR